MMPPSTNIFYRARLDEILKLNTEGQPCEVKIEEFIQLLTNDQEYAKKLQVSADKIHLISGRLIQIDEAVKTDVKTLYEDLPAVIQQDPGLKRRLYEAAALMYWNKNNRNNLETCKYMFVQLELVCEYLIIKYGIVGWAETKNAATITGKPKYGIDTTTYRGQIIKYFKTGIKVTAVWDYLTAEKGDILLGKDYIRDVKEMRDFASHGYHANTILQKQTFFSNVDNRFDWYVTKWVELLLQLKVHLL